MSRKNKDIENEDINIEDTVDTEEAAADENGAETASDAKPSEAPETSESPDSGDLSDKLNEAKDKLLRKIAEFDNYKKRTAKEKTENFAYGACDAAEKLIPVLDNLSRAVASAEANDDKAALFDGVKMIETQFRTALSEIGVEEIDAEGKEFDPEKHNAVMMEDSDLPSGTVIEELAKGYIYKKGDVQRVIRHSMVKVSN